MIIALSRQTAKRELLFSKESILGVALDDVAIWYNLLPPFPWLVERRTHTEFFRRVRTAALWVGMLRLWLPRVDAVAEE